MAWGRVRRSAALLAVAVLGVAAVGCGDDGPAEVTGARSAPEGVASLATEQSTSTSSPESGTTATTAPGVQPTGVSVTVTALDNTFRPARIEINVGDEVIWDNRGRNEHNVLQVEAVAGGVWGVEVDQFQPGDVYAHVFTEPGEYRYFCSIHGNEDVGMVGTIIVTG